MNLDELLARVIDAGGSDMHLKVTSPAMVRVDGDLQPLEQRLLTDSDLETVLLLVTDRSPAKREQFLESGDLDTSYLADGLGRFRVNGFRQRGSISFAFRFVPKEIPSFERLGLPEGVGKLAQEHRGLVLVTGATGSGKSTTLAAMLNWINRNRKQHIVTIEDPIEFIHDDWASIVNQREVGLDTESFKQALRRVLRQDPDVILIGELRDEETTQTALQAAESGHLVFSTLHTLDAAETIGRLVEFYPPQKQMMVREILAGVLRGVVSQRPHPAQGRRPRRGHRGDGQHRPHRRPDPRAGEDARPHGGDRGRRLPPHAELLSAPRPARRRRRRRARGRCGGGHQPPRLRDRGRAGAAPQARRRGGQDRGRRLLEPCGGRGRAGAEPEPERHPASGLRLAASDQ